MANGKYAFNFTELGLDYPLKSSTLFQQGDMRATFFTEKGVPYIQFYRRKDSTESSYENIFLLTFYYNTPKRVLRQCRPAPANDASDANWQDLCRYLLGDGAKITDRGWLEIVEN